MWPNQSVEGLGMDAEDNRTSERRQERCRGCHGSVFPRKIAFQFAIIKRNLLIIKQLWFVSIDKLTSPIRRLVSTPDCRGFSSTKTVHSQTP